MSMNATNMAAEIVDAFITNGRYPGLNASQINAIKADMTIMTGAIILHIVTNMEINGVTISSGTTLLDSPAPLIPVINDGGAAVSTQMVGNAANNTLTQNNGGTGRVS